MNASTIRWVVLAVSVLIACRANVANAEPTGEGEPDTRQRPEIEHLLGKYERAVNASDVQGVVQLYADDGVLLPEGAPSIVGIKAIQKFYTGAFRAVAVNLKFQIAEVQVLSNEWAFVRMTSTGVSKTLANGTKASESTQALILLHKKVGEWKLARYAFSSTVTVRGAAIRTTCG